MNKGCSLDVSDGYSILLLPDNISFLENLSSHNHNYKVNEKGIAEEIAQRFVTEGLFIFHIVKENRRNIIHRQGIPFDVPLKKIHHNTIKYLENLYDKQSGGNSQSAKYEDGNKNNNNNNGNTLSRKMKKYSEKTLPRIYNVPMRSSREKIHLTNIRWASSEIDTFPNCLLFNDREILMGSRLAQTKAAYLSEEHELSLISTGEYQSWDWYIRISLNHVGGKLWIEKSSNSRSSNITIWIISRGQRKLFQKTGDSVHREYGMIDFELNDIIQVLPMGGIEKFKEEENIDASIVDTKSYVEKNAIGLPHGPVTFLQTRIDHSDLFKKSSKKLKGYVDYLLAGEYWFFGKDGNQKGKVKIQEEISHGYSKNYYFQWFSHQSNDYDDDDGDSSYKYTTPKFMKIVCEYQLFDLTLDSASIVVSDKPRKSIRSGNNFLKIKINLSPDDIQVEINDINAFRVILLRKGSVVFEKIKKGQYNWNWEHDDYLILLPSSHPIPRGSNFEYSNIPESFSKLVEALKIGFANGYILGARLVKKQATTIAGLGEDQDDWLSSSPKTMNDEWSSETPTNKDSFVGSHIEFDSRWIGQFEKLDIPSSSSDMVIEGNNPHSNISGSGGGDDIRLSGEGKPGNFGFSETEETDTDTDNNNDDDDDG